MVYGCNISNTWDTCAVKTNTRYRYGTSDHKYLIYASDSLSRLFESRTSSVSIGPPDWKWNENWKHKSDWSPIGNLNLGKIKLSRNVILRHIVYFNSNRDQWRRNWESICFLVQKA